MVETETADVVFTYANCTDAASYSVEVGGSVAGSDTLSEESGTITSITLTETSEVKVIILNADNEEIISATKTITLPEPTPEPSLYFTDENDNVITSATITGTEQKLIKYVGENAPDGATYEITQTGTGITKWSTPPNGFTVMRGVFDDSTFTNTFTVNMKVSDEVVATNSIVITSEPAQG